MVSKVREGTGCFKEIGPHKQLSKRELQKLSRKGKLLKELPVWEAAEALFPYGKQT
jgi:hypothetical protein